jgi:hypothetical protein
MSSIDSTHGLDLMFVHACSAGMCLSRVIHAGCLAVSGQPASHLAGRLAIWLGLLIFVCVWSALSASYSVGSWGWLLCG